MTKPYKTNQTHPFESILWMILSRKTIDILVCSIELENVVSCQPLLGIRRDVVGTLQEKQRALCSDRKQSIQNP